MMGRRRPGTEDAMRAPMDGISRSIAATGVMIAPRWHRLRTSALPLHERSATSGRSRTTIEAAPGAGARADREKVR